MWFTLCVDVSDARCFFLQVKTEGALQSRARKQARISALLVILLYIGLGVWTYLQIDGYALQSIPVHDGPSNPTYKEVILQAGAWFDNYKAYPITMLVPLLALFSAFLAFIFARKTILAFILSGLSVGTIIATVGVSMFPFILPSSSNPKFSLLVWDSSSSQLTLFIMLIVTAIFLPIILAYTAWVYRVLRGKVTESSIKNADSAY